MGNWLPTSSPALYRGQTHLINLPGSLAAVNFGVAAYFTDIPGNFLCLGPHLQ